MVLEDGSFEIAGFWFAREYLLNQDFGQDYDGSCKEWVCPTGTI